MSLQERVNKERIANARRKCVSISILDHSYFQNSHTETPALVSETIESQHIDRLVDFELLMGMPSVIREHTHLGLHNSGILALL